ncbi:MAG: formylglycine-generating enzyme family protein [bacterium]
MTTLRMHQAQPYQRYAVEDCTVLALAICMVLISCPQRMALAQSSQQGISAQSGIKIKAGSSITFGPTGEVVGGAAGFWNGIEGRSYFAQFRDSDGEPIAVVEVNGKVQWDAESRIVGGIDAFRRMKVESGGPWLAIVQREMPTSTNDRLILSLENGARYAATRFDPGFSGVMRKLKAAKHLPRVKPKVEPKTAVRKGSPAVENSLGMKLIKIPAGTCVMGSNDYSDERPKHRITISKPFLLGAHEVTVSQFRRFIYAARYKTEMERGLVPRWGWDETTSQLLCKPKHSWQDPGYWQPSEHPAVNVSWNDANAFCEWLSDQEGSRYRLPTEAEWEYACRAGTTTRYNCGNDPEKLVRVGNVPDRSLRAVMHPSRNHGALILSASDGWVTTAPVGSFHPNAFGLYDMHGNVREWCSDWYKRDYYAASPSTDPKGPATGTCHVLRGGSWFTFCSSSYRGRLTRGVSHNVTGFRVARDLP